MRIAIDIRSLLDDSPGGIKTYATEIVRAMRRVAPQHDFFLFYNSAKEVNLPDFNGVEIRGFRYPNKIFNASQWLLAQPKWDKLIEADCFFAPALRLMPLNFELPLVATVHDLSFAYFPEFYSWRRRMWHTVMRPGLLMNNSDHLIAVSRATARDVLDYYNIDEKKVSVIYSGVNPPALASPAGEATAGKHPYILFLGTIEPRKNVPSIIRAFGAIADKVSHDLVIAGSRGWLTHEVDLAVRESGFKDRIKFIGVVDESDKQKIYTGADLFVYPSFYEGFGFPPLEALLAGTPVITSHNSSLPEVVGEWATMVNPYDPGELAAVMKEMLLRSPSVSPEIKQKIIEKYSWDRAARETLKVIEGVV